MATWLSDLTGMTTNPLLKEGGGGPLPYSTGVAGGGGDKIRIGIFDSPKGIVLFDH